MLGVILGGTSSAVVVPITNVLDIEPTTKTTLLLESAATDVLCILTLFSLVEFYEQDQAFSVIKFISSIGASFIMAIVFGLFAGTLWLIIIDKIKKFPKHLNNYHCLAIYCLWNNRIIFLFRSNCSIGIWFNSN